MFNLNTKAMKKNTLKPEHSGKIPLEAIRMENELLKLKISAENGAHFGTAPGLLPEIENQFLKNVIDFEKRFAAGPYSSYLGPT